MEGIFISYARKDKKRVQRIAREVHALGFDYWMDTRNLQGGDIWPQEITDAILARDKFLLLMSSASMASDSVQREVQIAYENKKKIIILRLENVDIPPSLKYQLARIQWIEFSAPDWKSRIALALRSRSKPSSTLRTKSATQSPPVKIQTTRIQGAQKIASELKNIFASNGTFYKDQCTTILAQIDDLHSTISKHWTQTSTEYQQLMPRIYLLEKVIAIGDLVKEFQGTCPPGSHVQRQAIHRELRSLVEDLSIK
jgi:hypothetical protein